MLQWPMADFWIIQQNCKWGNAEMILYIILINYELY